MLSIQKILVPVVFTDIPGTSCTKQRGWRAAFMRR